MGQLGVETVLRTPIVGERLATVFFGGFSLSRQTLRLAFRYHYAIVAIGVLGLVAVVRVRVYGQYPPGKSPRAE